MIALLRFAVFPNNRSTTRIGWDTAGAAFGSAGVTDTAGVSGTTARSGPAVVVVVLVNGNTLLRRTTEPNLLLEFLGFTDFFVHEFPDVAPVADKLGRRSWIA